MKPSAKPRIPDVHAVAALAVLDEDQECTAGSGKTTVLTTAIEAAASVGRLIHVVLAAAAGDDGR